MLDPITLSTLASGAMSAGGALASLFGKSKKPSLTPIVPPELLKRQQEVYNMGLQGMQNPTAGFEPIANQARRQFQTQTIPSLAERFTNFGQGTQRSSDFAGALGGAGTDLESNLAALASQYGLQRMGQLQNLLNMGMGSAGDYLYQPEQMGKAQAFGANLFGSAMPGFLSGINEMASNYSERQNQNKLLKQLKALLEGANNTTDNITESNEMVAPVRTAQMALNDYSQTLNNGYTPRGYSNGTMAAVNPDLLNMLLSSLR